MASAANADDIVAGVWRRRLEWSAAANGHGEGIRRARRLALWLGIGGAVLETTAASLPGDWDMARTIVAGVGTIMLALATWAANNFLAPDETRRWTTARAVSETIKGEVYRFRTHATPYAGADRAQVLLSRVLLAEKVDANLGIQLIARPSPTSKAPVELDADAYVAERVVAQQDFLEDRASKYARLSRRYHTAVMVLGGIATAIGGATTLLSTLGADNLIVGAWASVLMTGSGSLTTYIAAARYDFFVTSYTAVRHQLGARLMEWQASDREAAAWSTFVEGVEIALAAENQTWAAKLLAPNGAI